VVGLISSPVTEWTTGLPELAARLKTACVRRYQGHDRRSDAPDGSRWRRWPSWSRSPFCAPRASSLCAITTDRGPALPVPDFFGCRLYRRCRLRGTQAPDPPSDRTAYRSASKIHGTSHSYRSRHGGDRHPDRSGDRGEAIAADPCNRRIGTGVGGWAQANESARRRKGACRIVQLPFPIR
jgi:hypothetical protein